MAVYMSAFLIAIAIANMAKKKKGINNKKSCIYMILAGIPFILVSGLRYYVGTDYGIYQNIFNIVKLGGNIIDIERGYLWLNKVVANFADDYQVILFVVATITICCYFISIYLLSSDVMISVFVWFVSLCFFESMNTVRQSLAVSLFFVGIYFIYLKKWWYYIVIILIAREFHASAIFLIIMYWIVYRRSNIKWHIGLIMGLLVSGQLINKLIQFLPLPERYLKYFENVYIYTDFRFMDFVIAVCVWGIAWYFRKFIEPEQIKKYDLFLNLQFVAVLITIASGTIPMAYRLIMYFVYIPVFIIPEVLRISSSAKNRRFIKVSLTIAYTMQWAYYVYVVGIDDFIKYTSILSR